MEATRLAKRVIARLAQAEACEPDLHLRDDLKIARLTVQYAATGEAVLCSPHVLASYKVLGLHPDKVWSKIQERRRALGIDKEFSGWKFPPKKPPQSAVGNSHVKLWFEDRNAARVSGSRGGEAVDLCDQTISVPMAAPSIAALYPNPDAPSSAKSREFTLAELKQIVGYSGAPDSVCALTISALRARGEWPHEDGPATSVISVAIIGMMLEGVCCRRTVQRRIKRAVQLGYWKRVRDANSWTNCPKCGKPRTAAQCGSCNYRGRSKDDKGKWTGEFLRVPVYEFDVQKFRTAPRCREIHHLGRTYAEYKAAPKQAEVIDMTSRKPAQPAPISHDAHPAKIEHRSPARPEPKVAQPKLTRRDCAKFIANVEQRRRGRTSYFSRGDGLAISLHPGEEGYAAPMTWSAAFAAECESWRREPDIVREALVHWGYKLQE